MRPAPSPLIALSTAERRAAAETLAAGFFDDPLFAWIVPSGARRQGWLAAFMRASLRMVEAAGESWRAAGDGAIPAVVSLVAPGRYPMPFASQLGFTGCLLPRLLVGQPTPRRAWQAGRALARIDALHPGEPHWYFFQLAVHPSHQGRGLGRAIMDHGLERADADGVPAYLETSNPGNLDFYGRFGFEVREEVRLGAVPPIWTMRRAARGEAFT